MLLGQTDCGEGTQYTSIATLGSLTTAATVGRGRDFRADSDSWIMSKNRGEYPALLETLCRLADGFKVGPADLLTEGVRHDKPNGSLGDGDGVPHGRVAGAVRVANALPMREMRANRPVANEDQPVDGWGNCCEASHCG